MSYLQDVHSTIFDDENHILASDSFCAGMNPYQGSNPIVSHSGQQILDTKLYNKDRQCPSKSDWLRGRAISSDETHVSPDLAGWGLADWNTPIIATPTSHGTHNAMDDQSTNAFPGYQHAKLGNHRTNSCTFEDTDATSGKSQVSQGSTKMDLGEYRYQVTASQQKTTTTTYPVRCWLHTCNGRSFTHISNYRRHCREKSGLQVGSSCSLCGKHFTRKAARKAHTDQQRCRFVDHDENGIPFERKRCAEELNTSTTGVALGNPQPLDY